MTAAFLYDAVRTPFGRFGGALAEVRPDDLAATTLRAVLDRSPDLDPATVGDVVWGNANGAGEDNRNVGRMAVLLAGLPVSVPATTVNRLCGSSLDAAMAASRTVESGDADVVVAGGVESMTRAPWVLPKPSRAFPAGNVTAVSTALGWRLVNERMPAEWTVSLGEANELLADRSGISRERQDAFAARSHRLAAAAWDAGRYDDLVVAVPGVDLARDEGIRPDTSEERLAALKPSFRPDGTITAGNASPLSDGASALLLGSESAADADRPRAARAGRRARRARRRAAALRDRAGRGGRAGARRAPASPGPTWPRVELNEAFAVQSLACVDGWGVDPEIVNAWGGAIALGHPLGASGARVLGTLAAAAAGRRATGGASPRSASASVRRWRWCSRTSPEPGRGQRRRRPQVAGPSSTSPSAPKREPWSGQSQLSSASFQRTTPPRWVHTAGDAPVGAGDARRRDRQPGAVDVHLALALERSRPCRPAQQRAQPAAGHLPADLGVGRVESSSAAQLGGAPGAHAPRPTRRGRRAGPRCSASEAATALVMPHLE